MSSPEPTPLADTPDEIRELLQQRDRVREWLDRLRSVDTDVPGRIAERVRADYTARLERLTEDLGRHAAALEQQLAELREAQQRAEDAAAEAEDALLEARLRHQLGEITPEQWEERQPGLEQATRDAEAGMERARAAAGSLAELVGEIGAGQRLPEPPEPPEPSPVEDIPWLAVEEPPTREDFALLGGMEDATVEEAPAPEADMAFLEELDRAIAASTRSGGRAEAPEAEGSAPPVVACRECGSANDAQAWYCEICGSEL